MRLSDAGLRQHPTKLIYPNHRLPPWLTEDATPRSLEPIVRRGRLMPSGKATNFGNGRTSTLHFTGVTAVVGREPGGIAVQEQ